MLKRPAARRTLTVALLFAAVLALSATGRAMALEPSTVSTSAGHAVQVQVDALRLANGGSRIAPITTGQYAGKNVIMIQVEALQGLVIGKKYGGKEITPNLNALIRQSWYFPNTFSQVGSGKTVDAEFIVNTSLYAPTYAPAPTTYADYELPGLPRLLRAKGYDAITLHQNDVRFWNRIDLYPGLGFRRWWDRSYFGLRDKMWHASDQTLFGMGMQPLKSEAKTRKPFYSLFITESSHVPFKAIPRKRYALQKVSAADAKTLSGRYIGSESYTDLAIGEFIGKLKKAGLWDSSIVIIYGDHSAELDSGSKADRRIADKLLGRVYGDIDRQRIPLIIHLPRQKAGKVSSAPAGQVDIMPTIADLVGLDLSNVPHMGRSVFLKTPSFVPLRAFYPPGSFVDDSVLFIPNASAAGGRVVGVRSGKPGLPTVTEFNWVPAASQLTTISDAWVKSLPIRPDATHGKTAIIPH
jgi:phosphoglycerol transferase MdoB-like AlkP superfamily enzyme